MKLKDFFVAPTDSIQATLARINQSRHGIAFVVEEDAKLRGTVTDGDIRRAILQNIPLLNRVETIMNKEPTVLSMGSAKESILAAMVSREIRQLPLIDKKGRVVDVRFIEDLMEVKRDEPHVLLMAGGLGKRLRPLTKETPKPMLHVGGRPILETLISHLNTQGFKKVNIAVRHKSKVIEDYFTDGEKFNTSIRYIREKKRLGTAGALSLVNLEPKSSIIVMNADILTKVNFRALMDYHKQGRYDITVCIRKLEIQVPYGVAEVDAHNVVSLTEKPRFPFFINAGIYALNQEVQKRIPKNTYIDMPKFINRLVKEGKKIGSFPLVEYWLDIGRMDDYLLAHKHFDTVFGEENELAKN